MNTPLSFVRSRDIVGTRRVKARVVGPRVVVVGCGQDHEGLDYVIRETCLSPMIASVRRTVPRSVRSLASVSSSNVGPFTVFDRKAKQLQRDRAAAKDGGKSSATVDYVRDEVADRLLERLEVTRIIYVLATVLTLIQGH